MSVLSRLRKKEKGQAMVEFALVLPILIGLICGIIDFGWLFYNYLSLQNACREGARRACVISQDAECEATVKKKVIDMLPEGLKGSADVHVTFSNNSSMEDRIKGEVTVTTEANIYFLTPVLGTVYKEKNGGKKITSTLVMKVES